MIKHLKYYKTAIVAVITVTMFFSCRNNFNEVQKLGLSANEPINITEYIEGMVYTDSGKMVATMTAPKRLDFSNRKFPYEEYPEGVYLEIFDDQNEKSIVESNYGLVYSNTGVIDLRGNVRITASDSTVLKSPQIYFIQDEEWLFTNKVFSLIKTNGDVLNGHGFDSDIHLKKYEALELSGDVTLEDD